MAYLYADYYEKRFRSKCCSLVTLAWLVCLFLAVAIPYYICWASNGKTPIYS